MNISETAQPDSTALRGGLRPGELLDGKWELRDKIGEGGMGAVYLAHDVALDRSVAVKMLVNAQLATPELVARFEREARTMAKLDHPNLVAVHAVGNREGLPFIVMKYLEGESLGQLIARHAARQQTLSPKELLSIARQICAGLSYLHQQGFVHRDIKPGNIFVGSDGRVTILDLGIARPRQSALTQAGTVVGSPMYMAPEQITGAADLDARADLYALGVVLFEMLTGQPPFDAPSDFQVMRRHFDDPPPDPALLNPSLPEQVGVALKKAMAKHRDDRFGSASELYAALESALAGVSEAPQRIQTQVAPVQAQTKSLVAAGVKRSWWPVSVAAGAALVVSIGFVASRPTEGLEPVVVAAPPPPRAPEPIEPPPAPEAAVAPVAPVASVASVADAPEPRRVEPARTGRIQVSVTLDGKVAWGWVDLDGLRQGVTPMTFEAAPGSRVVRISRPGFRDVKREVVIKPGALQKLVVALEPR